MGCTSKERVIVKKWLMTGSWLGSWDSTIWKGLCRLFTGKARQVTLERWSSPRLSYLQRNLAKLQWKAGGGGRENCQITFSDMVAIFSLHCVMARAGTIISWEKAGPAPSETPVIWTQSWTGSQPTKETGYSERSSTSSLSYLRVLLSGGSSLFRRFYPKQERF